MSTTYHCCIDLDALARLDGTAVAFLRHYGPDEAKGLSNEAIVAQAVIRRAKGMTAWPLCEHHDKTGHCKGHPQ